MRPNASPKRWRSCPTSASSTSPAAAATARSRRRGAPGATPSAPTSSRRCWSERAAAERLEVEFVEADAQDLPFEDASFDVAMSIFGAMFAPDQERTAAELLRVVKPGGRIGMANWTPDGSLTDFFAILTRHTGGPPPGTVPPVLWGSEERVRELFGDGISELRVERRVSRQAFRSPEHYLDFFRTYFGPLRSAFEKVGPEGAPALEAELRDYLETASTDPRALVLEPDYLQVVATRA
jgi:SAM-dependent methyltransferase